MTRYLVIISREQPELLGTFASLYNSVPGVELRFDRRHNEGDSKGWERADRRAPLARDALLRGPGFMVILQP